MEDKHEEEDPYAYKSMEESAPRAASTISVATTILLAILLGVGVHSSKEALGPAEPTLEAVGVTPVMYALLTIAPTAMSFFTPLLWGALSDYKPSIIPILAPLGELSGAILITAGLHLLLCRRECFSVGEYPAATPLAAVGLLGGILLSSGCRAGIAVAECVAIGQAGGGSTTVGFSSMVVAKHATGITSLGNQNFRAHKLQSLAFAKPSSEANLPHLKMVSPLPLDDCHHTAELY